MYIHTYIDGPPPDRHLTEKSASGGAPVDQECQVLGFRLSKFYVSRVFTGRAPTGRPKIPPPLATTLDNRTLDSASWKGWHS